MKNQVTIIHVAEAAGVSTATVSNVLNRRNVPLSADIIQRVEEAAAQLGYRRNVKAANLSQRRTYEIGLLLPGFGGYFGSFTECLEFIAHRHGYKLVIFSSRHDPQTEQRHLDMLLQHRVDGLICHGLSMSADSARLILQDGTPLVLFNAWNWPQDLAVGAVNPRFAQACRDAVHHLYERSCRAIYYVGSTQTRATGEERNRGYREGIAELQGLVGEGEFMTDQISISEVVKLLAERHQDDGPIGIVAFDDSIAFQFLSRLQELGYKAPQHFKIVGCNNEYLAKECFPALTTIGVPYELQARLAFRMLLQHMDPSKGLEQEDIEHFSFPLPKEQRSIDIPLQLIERLSTQ